jgi:hypothetical protein
LGGSQEVRDSMGTLCELEGPHTRLIKHERSVERLRGRRIHPWTQIGELAAPLISSLDDGRSELTPKSGRMNQVRLGKDADGKCPLERRQSVVERTAHVLIVCDESGRLPSALKEVSQRVGAVLPGAGRSRDRWCRHEQ